MTSNTNTNEINFTVNKPECTHCGLCIKICPCGIIRKSEDSLPKIPSKLEKFCIGCQHCFAVCPAGAISILGNKVEKTNSKSDNDIENILKMRRSCRFYKNENISSDKMAKLKDILQYAPTGCNSRGLYFYIVDNAETMDKIRNKMLSFLKKIAKFVPNFNGFIVGIKKKILSGNDLIFQNAPHMLIACVSKKAPCRHIDPVIALSQFEIYANSLGLGTLWCGIADGCLRYIPALKKFIKVPKGYKIAYVMLFGEPAIKFARSTKQKAYPIVSVG